MLCSTDQKWIIDDTLTMSKLDSSLLLVTPVDTQPVKVVGQILRTFETHFSYKGITARLVVHPSYSALKIDWLKADPSRFTQVLVNLVTNGNVFQVCNQFKSSSSPRKDKDDSSPSRWVRYLRLVLSWKVQHRYRLRVSLRRANETSFSSVSQ